MGIFGRNYALLLTICLIGSGCEITFNHPKQYCFQSNALLGWWNTGRAPGPSLVDLISGNSASLINVLNSSYSSSLTSGRFASFSQYGSSATAALTNLYLTNQITLSARVKTNPGISPVSGSIVSQGERSSTWGTFTSYDASYTDGISTVAYQMGVFDGRYIYFTPPNGSSPVMLRYDTLGPFSASSSWSGY